MLTSEILTPLLEDIIKHYKGFLQKAHTNTEIQEES